MGICDGRVVIVTGAGRGIGREHALEFAATVERYVTGLRLRVVAVDVTVSAP